MSTISGLRPCFINFTRDLLLRSLPASFPANLLVIIAHEIGDQAACRTALDSIGVSPEALQQSYLQALTFVEQVYI